MARTWLILVLCIIGLTQTACARRTGRAVRLPSAPGVSSAQKPPRSDASKQVRDAIQSLKDRLGTKAATETPAAAAGGGASASAVQGASASGDSRSVGTSGMVSVENRYPAAPGASSSDAGTSSSGRLLSRAEAALRNAGGGSWLGVIALCALAGAIVIVLARRRARTTT